jgi:hypothetical protein
MKTLLIKVNQAALVIMNKELPLQQVMMPLVYNH